MSLLAPTNLMRASAFFLSLALMQSACASEARALLDVRVEHAGVSIKHASVVATAGHTAVIEATRPFKVAVAACAGTGAARYEEGGAGKAGVTVVLGLVADGPDAAKVSVSLASAEVARLVAIRAGACSGQTPVMLKFDAKAMFGLRPGQHQQLQVGDYVVTVELRDLRHADAPVASGLRT